VTGVQTCALPISANLKFAFIHEHRQEFPVEIMCEILDVSRSGFYAWLDRPPSWRQRRRDELLAQIRQVHQDSRQTYGSPRICRQLQDQQVVCCRNTVAKLMKDNGIRSKTRRRFKVQTTDSNHNYAVAPNRLDRQFTQARPDRVWVSDITYVPTDEGWLYLAAVLDLCSRKVVGWSMAEHLEASLVIEALEMALARRSPQPGLLVHSDRGVQYACDAFQGLLSRHRMSCSMSRKGNCYDNAVNESFFGTLKTELIHHEHYVTRAQARASIFEYVEVFYNRRRLHSSIGYQSPEAFEASLC
jgi:putative transposase